MRSSWRISNRALKLLTSRPKKRLKRFSKLSDNYRDRVIAAIANAKDMEANARKAGNLAEAERHKLAAEIYQSILDSLGLRQ